MINLLEEEAVHIAGVLVKAFPHHAPAVAVRLNTLPGTEVHEISKGGNMVVTVEATDREKNIVDIITRLTDIDGVLDVSLIFHHNDAVSVAYPSNSKIIFK